MRAFVCVAAFCCVAACSYTFDDAAVDVQLIGKPPATDSLPRLNHASAGSEFIIHGDDDAWWVGFNETQTMDFTSRNGVRLVRLSPPEREEIIVGDDIEHSADTFFIINKNVKDPLAPVELTLRRVAQTTPTPHFTLPHGPAFLDASGGTIAFLYWVLDARTTTFQVLRRDQSFQRALPVPDGVDPLDPFRKGQIFWMSNGSLVFTRDAAGLVVAHSTTAERDTALGVRPKLLMLDEERKALVTCGEDGLRLVAIDASGEKVLDPSLCDVTGTLFELDGRVYYSVGDEIRKVDRDGGAPEVVLRGGLRIIGWDPNYTPLYSRTPSDLFVNGAGDGWYGSWRFMERGIGAGFSGDGKRLRWLEHAARGNASGELLSAELGARVLHLTRNTHQYEELADGRVLADANHAFRGTQNRIVVIDEKRRTAHWVAAAAARYDRIPDSDDLLVDVVTGPSVYDIVRVPIPSPEP